MPRRIRPKFPKEWHVPEDSRLWITWPRADEKLTKEDVYWISTSSDDCRPHAAPVWGVWKGDKFYFETGPNSVKGKNLRTNPRIVVHLQDGMDTVIVEGTAALLDGPRELAQLKKDYLSKYDYAPDWSDQTRQVVFRVTPHVAHAWRAPKMHRTLVNFIF